MIRWQYLARIGLLFALLGSSLPGTRAVAQNAPSFVPGRLLVQFRPTATADQVRNLVAAANARDTAEIPHTGVHILKLPANASEAAMARAFAQRPEVVFAELDQILPAQAI